MAGARRTARRPRRRGGWRPSLVESHLADRRRLLLHARLPAGHRPAGGGRRGADCDRHSRAGHAARRAADLRTGGRAQLCRAGIDRAAREPAGGLEGKSAGPAAARLRRHGLRHHDDVVRGRRRQARHRESVSPRGPWRAPDARDARDPRHIGRRVSEGLLRGHRSGFSGGAAVPGVEPRRPGARRLRGLHAPGARRALAFGARREGRSVPDDRGRRPGVPEARTRTERLRDGRLCHAARRRRRAGQGARPA